MELLFNFFFNMEILGFGRMGVTRSFDVAREDLCFWEDSMESLVERADWTLGSAERESLAKDRAWHSA